MLSTTSTAGAITEDISDSHDGLERTAEKALPILPKGFVRNTSEVYAEVASFDVLPATKLHEYWRVYTTTNRTLCDPTAKRLESFWWHVWGSNLKNLPGSTLAKFYKAISKGPTFVPLRGPASRYEGPITPFPLAIAPGQQKSTEPKIADDVLVCDHIEQSSVVPEPTVEVPNSASGNEDREETSSKDLGTTTIDDHQTEQPEETANSDPPRAFGHYELISSIQAVSRQSILRKPRPSLSGPRPTPRFILPSETPHEENPIHSSGSGSARETATTNSVASGSGSASSGRAVRSPTSPNASSKAKRNGQKTSRPKHTKKKFVVASSSKRRALLSKRSGSHSSAASDMSGPTDELHLQEATQRSGVLLEEDEIEGDDAKRVSEGSLSSKGQGKLRQERRPRLRTSPSPSLTVTRSDSEHFHSSPASNNEPSQAEPSSVVKKAIPTPACHPARQSAVYHTPDHVFGSMTESAASSGDSCMLETPPTLQKRAPSAERVQPSKSLLGPSSQTVYEMTTPCEMVLSSNSQFGTLSFSGALPGMGSPSSTTKFFPSPGLGAGSFIAPVMARSTSQDSYVWRLRQQGSGPLHSPTLPPGIGSPTVAASSTVAVCGVISETDGHNPLNLYAKTGLVDDDDNDDGNDDGHISAAGEQLSMSEQASFAYNDPNPLHRPLFTPTRPTPTPRIPFARTRSQLNIILERERERLGQGGFASWQESRARDHNREGANEGNRRGTE